MIKCAYCGKEMIDMKRPINDKNYKKVYRSSEHIIQNAIGGKDESKDICCDRCNYHLEHLIDKAFCDIFVPFTSSIPHFTKSRKSEAARYSGHCFNHDLGENSIFTADIIKGTSPCVSHELIDKLKTSGVTDIKTQIIRLLQNSTILSSDFKLDNTSFRNGLAKIAFNFAIHSGISSEKLKPFINVNLSVDTGEMENISFKTQLIPFVALNDFDKSIEFSPFSDEFPPFHNIILFRYQTQLWCFINLFDTFQWYVKMSDNFTNDNELECEVIKSSLQFIQSSPTKTEDKKTERLKMALELKDEDMFLLKRVAAFTKQDEITDFYLDSNDGGFKNKYHIICASTDNAQKRLFGRFYPMCVQEVQNAIYSHMHKIIREYTVKKFNRLSYYSNASKPTLNQDFFSSLSDDDLKKFIALYKQSCVSNRVTKQIDLNLLFPDSSDTPTEESTIKNIIFENSNLLKLQYDGNVNIVFINRSLGPSSLDSLINKIANEFMSE